ncbi:Interleukin-27 receptor subunit alpha, partial [Ophiophagus hannah]
MGLQCFQPFRSNFVNCSWLTWESQNANAIYVLHYESLKLGKLLPDLGQVHSMVAQMGQNWLVIDRTGLTHGDEYSIWMEVRSADEIAVSKKLNFSLDEIVKPCLPELDHVELDCSEATVIWKNPHWFEFHNDQPLTYAIRYKASTDHEWTYVTPFGQVDVWQKGCISDRQNESCLLLWKALDPEAAQGTILDYEVIVQDHSKAVHRMNYNCCQALIPIAAQYVSIAARNSVKKTPWANLSLEKTELPDPEDITVVASEGLGLNVTWKPSMDSQWVQPQKYVVEWRKEIIDSAGELLNWTSTPGSSTSALLRVPSAGPQGLQDRRLSSTATSISWEEIPLADRNGHIIHYTLYLKHLHSGSLMVHAPINAMERNYIISDLEPGTTYKVWMTGSTSAGEGAASTVHHFSTSGYWVTAIRSYLGGVGRKFQIQNTEILIKYSTQFPEIMDIAEISEEIPEPSPPPRAGSNT